MEMLGTLPQWVTVGTAIFALVAAFLGIKTQRELARKRAAMDFFTKTDMDKEMLGAHTKYTAAMDLLTKEGMPQFIGSKESYGDLRSYLNLHELMAVGVKHGIFDDDVCYDFWSGEVERAYPKITDFILHIQKTPEERCAYCELLVLAKRWEGKTAAAEGKSP